MAEPSIAEAMSRAGQAYRLGHWQKAQELFDLILLESPDNAQALHFSGLIDLEKSNALAAIEKLERAVAVDGHAIDIRIALARALSEVGRDQDAWAELQIVSRSARATHQITTQIAQLFSKIGRFSEAEKAFRRMVSNGDKHAKTFNGLGLALINLGRLDEAESALRSAILLTPNYAEPYVNLGLIYTRRGQIQSAAEANLRAIEIDPLSVPALNNLGTIYSEIDQPQLALDCYRTALRLQPRSAAAHANVGVALRRLGRFGEARDSFEVALKINPDELEAVIGMGVVSDVAGDSASAIRYYDRALAINSSSANARTNRSLTLLRSKRLSEGWQDFHWRWAIKGVSAWTRPFTFPAWTEADTGKGAILVWGEQGVGDEIFYSAMLPDLFAAGIPIVFECDLRLVPLYRRTWPSVRIVGRTNPPQLECSDPDIRFQAPVASLGKWFRRSADSIPPKPCVLKYDLEKSRKYREQMLASATQPPQLVVGISWKSPQADFASEKSCDVLEWKSILTIPGVLFVDFQYGETDEDRDALRRAAGIELFRVPKLDIKSDLDNLAAAIGACDLIITVSNSTAHLAGAVGVPTWVMVPSGNGKLWYWFRDSGPSPWYRAVTVYHQGVSENWKSTIQAINSDLKTLRGPRKPFWKLW